MTLEWDINTAGTQAVLRTTAANIDAQNAAAKDLGLAVEEAGAVVGRGIVAKALSDYVELSLVPHLASIDGKSSRIIQGTSDALVAYVQADSVMAQNAQAAALAANGPGFDGGSSPQRPGEPQPGLG